MPQRPVLNPKQLPVAVGESPENDGPYTEKTIAPRVFGHNWGHHEDLQVPGVLAIFPIGLPQVFLPSRNTKSAFEEQTENIRLFSYSFAINPFQNGAILFSA